MKIISKQITDILNEEYSIINEKIKGTPYLENLKFKILAQIENKIDKSSYNELEVADSEFMFENSTKKIYSKIKVFKSPKINLNTILDKNLLLICLNETIKIDLKDSKTKKNFNINLIQNTGLTLSKDTQYSSNFKKNSVIIEIICEEKNHDIEKK